jgi:predicted HNH restriction endonuclease
VAILQRTGSKDNGVFARGIVTSEPYEDHRGIRVAALKLDSFLPIGKEIPREEIVRIASYQKNWMPMASGNVVPDPIYQAIQTLWRKRISSDENEESLPEELVGLEGERLRRMVAHRRREFRLRKQKINSALRENGSLSCEVPGCGFDFLRAYGELGAGYAHVHHLRPLADYRGQEQTRLSDLAIVCANCHAIIHRGGECRKLSTLIPSPNR